MLDIWDASMAYHASTMEGWQWHENINIIWHGVHIGASHFNIKGNTLLKMQRSQNHLSVVITVQYGDNFWQTVKKGKKIEEIKKDKNNTFFF